MTNNPGIDNDDEKENNSCSFFLLLCIACETAGPRIDGYDVMRRASVCMSDVYYSSRVSRHYLSYISQKYLSQEKCE